MNMKNKDYQQDLDFNQGWDRRRYHQAIFVGLL
jgi:hypothetical protein